MHNTKPVQTLHRTFSKRNSRTKNSSENHNGNRGGFSSLASKSSLIPFRHVPYERIMLFGLASACPAMSCICLVVVSYSCKRSSVSIAITKNIKLKVCNCVEVKALKSVALYILRMTLTLHLH